MNKLLINLLPSEFAVEKKREHKQGLVIRSSISVLILMIIVTATVLGFNIYQQLNIKKAEQELLSTQEKVSSLKDKEWLVFNLKNRLVKINQLSTTDSMESKAYLYVSGLIPSGIVFNSFATEQSSKVRLSGKAQDSAYLEEFYDLLDREKKSLNKVTAVKVDNLSQLKDNQLSFDLLISLSPSLAQVDLSNSTQQEDEQ